MFIDVVIHDMKVGLAAPAASRQGSFKSRANYAGEGTGAILCILSKAYEGVGIEQHRVADSTNRQVGVG